MQLINITEPGSIDIKKTMTTLEEAFDNNQMNGAVADISIDVATKITSNKNENVSKVEDIRDKTIKKQIEDKVKDLNGIVKTNGDAQKDVRTLALENNKIKTVDNAKLGHGSAANGQSNISFPISEPCNSPASTTPADVVRTDKNDINFDETVTSSAVEEIESKDKKTTSVSKISSVSTNNNDVTSGDSIEKTSALVDTQLNVFNEHVTDCDKSKHIEISVENKDIVQNVSAFSPNSDIDEKEVNISAQLQQLEDDVSIEDDLLSSSFSDKDISTENKCTVPEITIEVPELNAISQQKQENETQSQPENDLHFVKELDQKQKDSHQSHNQDNEAAEANIKIPPTVDKDNDKKSLEITPTDDKACNYLDTSLSVIKAADVSPDITETTDNTDEKEKVSGFLIESVEDAKNVCDSVMEVEDRILSQCQNEECNSTVDSGVKSPVQKCITVKKITDIACSDENDAASEVSDDIQPINKEQNQRHEVMEVVATDAVTLATSENGVSLTTSDKLLDVQPATVVKTNAETTDKEAIKDIIENNGLCEVSNSDSSVMEIDDVDEVSIVEKLGEDVAENGVIQNAAPIENCKELEKQDTIINITDNDDDEMSCVPDLCEVENDDTSQVISIKNSVKDVVTETFKKSSSKVEILDEDFKDVKETNLQKEESITEKPLVVCKLSNTMDILSDEEDDPPVVKLSEQNNLESEKSTKVEQNKCINLDDDDDIMFIEDTNSQGPKDDESKPHEPSDKEESQTTKNIDSKIHSDTEEEKNLKEIGSDEVLKINEKDSTQIEIDKQSKEDETKTVEPSEIKETKAPLITKSFLKSVTKNLADMTRNELEDFCILKLVESVVDKTNLNEIKIKMKTMAQSLEDLRKKAVALTKQNRDLQVVVKTVQEDQKKRNTIPMMPMKITRSVGMQVVLTMGEKSILKKKLTTPAPPPPVTQARPVRNMQSPKTQKPNVTNIPVPRLVPASPTVKSPATPVISAMKPIVPVRNSTPQRPEKRAHTKPSPTSSVTVDLTDDEPPAKINIKNPTPPVRLVPSQNLMAPKNKPQQSQPGNSPRKVYIPISSSNPNIRPGSAVVKNFVPTPRPRQPSVVRMQTVRLNQAPSLSRHPAPLPDAMKQYQPPTWKSLPPAPDLKLSKVDNGIVISWKFEGYQPDTYEEIASFQLYAYQETHVPASTTLWKKIGDIKALPLPMACTLTQFMSGFKYYFAVRAIDIRSRVGPFSLPGSIMLISKS